MVSCIAKPVAVVVPSLNVHGLCAEVAGVALFLGVAAESESQVGGFGAALGGKVVEGLVVSVLAQLDAWRAGDDWAAVITGLDRGTTLYEGVAIDVGEIVVHLVLFRGESVLELGDVVVGVFKANLDGDTSAVAVGLVFLRVFSTGFDNFFVVYSLVGDRPDADLLIALVFDDSPAEALSDNSGRESSESGSDEESLGMHAYGVVQKNVYNNSQEECVSSKRM